MLTDITLPHPYPLFVKRLAKTGAEILTGLTPLKCDIVHMALGVAGEACELMEPIRNWCHLGQSPLDIDNVKEELGDAEFFLEHLRDELGITRESTLGGPSEVVSHPAPFATTLLDAGMVFVIASGDLVKACKDWALFGKDEAKCRDGIIKALTRIEGALHMLRELNGLTLQAVMLANETKLEKRYAGLKFSNDAALARADKAVGPIVPVSGTNKCLVAVAPDAVSTLSPKAFDEVQTIIAEGKGANETLMNAAARHLHPQDTK